MISKIQYVNYDKKQKSTVWRNTGMLFNNKTGTLSYDDSEALGLFLSFFHRLQVGDGFKMQYEIDDMDKYYDSMLPQDRGLYIFDTKSNVRNELHYDDIKKVQLPNNATDVSIGIYHTKDIIGDGTFFITEAGYKSYFITHDRLYYKLKSLTLLEEEDDYNDFSNLEPTFNNNHITALRLNILMYMRGHLLPVLSKFTTNNAELIKNFETWDCSFYFMKGTPYLEMDKDEIIANLNKHHKNYTAYIYYGDTDENGKLQRRY